MKIDEMNARVRLEVSIEQADAMTKGLDLSCRIMMGQVDELCTLARSGRLLARDDRAKGGHRPLTFDEIENMQGHLRAISSILGHGGGSFGIGAPGVPIEAKRQYEIKKVVEKVVADHRQPGAIFVQNDGLIVRYTRDEKPRAQLETGEEMT